MSYGLGDELRNALDRNHDLQAAATGKVWWIVVPKDAEGQVSRLAYTNFEHADAVRKANDFDYASLAPFRIVMVRETAWSPQE